MNRILQLAGLKRHPELILILALTAVSGTLFSQTGSVQIRVVVENIRSDRGTLALALYRSPEGWPYEPEFDFFLKKDSLRDGRLSYLVNNLKPGRYALSVLDDENNDGEMDYFCGIPREGWGFCNNPPVLRLRPPRYEQCSFQAEGDSLTITVRMNYMGSGAKEQ